MAAVTADIAPTLRAATPIASARNRTLDVLRAVAILAMLVDHLALFVFAQQELDWNGRAIGRVAEPLFVVLAGYLLAGRPRRSLLPRLGQLVVAETLIAPLFFGVTQTLDILAALIPVMALHLVFGRHLVWLLPAFLLSPLDPLAPWFGYGIPLVASQVACGMLLHHRRGWVGAALFLLAGLVFDFEGALPLYLSIGAAGLVLFASRHPNAGLGSVAALGRRSLTFYVVHLWVVAAIGLGTGRAGWTFPLVERATHVTYTRLVPILPR